VLQTLDAIPCKSVNGPELRYLRHRTIIDEFATPLKSMLHVHLPREVGEAGTEIARADSSGKREALYDSPL
jgi:hypothetical protein